MLDALSGLTDESIRFLINTHIHPDHIGANAELADHGVLIFAHDLVREQMLDRIRIPRRDGVFFDQPPPKARPVVTYDSEITFHVNGEAVRSFLVPPSHTGGDSFVYFPSADVLHTGDVFRTNMYPIVDVRNGGTFSGMVEAIELAIDLAGSETKVIPGHGFGFTNQAGTCTNYWPTTDQVQPRDECRAAATTARHQCPSEPRSCRASGRGGGSS